METRHQTMLSQITRPTLLLDERRVRRNLMRMTEKARRCGVRLRPHFKTHQSAQIADWCRAAGVDAITVSSVSMATYFAAHGWRDITVAFPINLREVVEINRLAGQGTIQLLVDSPAAVEGLSAGLHSDVRIWIEIDTGYVRSGVAADDYDTLAAVSQAIARSSHMTLAGLLTHTGQSYGQRSKEGMTDLYAQTVEQMNGARRFLESLGGAQVEISLGDTPMASVVDDLFGIDEMRPGNFIFYDAMMVGIGACTEEDIAVAVACPVVARYPERREVVIYGGAVHLSKDFIRRPDGSADFGWVAPLTESGWGKAFPNTYLRSISQEHGVIRSAEETYQRFFSDLALGELVAILPVHSCLTADLHKRYLTLDGEWVTMMTL
jgi:D-serine deaminase-like pyridoxal phosphate-dependent protein